MPVEPEVGPTLEGDDTEPGLFTGIGTPSAYVVDADGAVAAELAYGAVEVPALLRELLARPHP